MWESKSHSESALLDGVPGVAPRQLASPHPFLVLALALHLESIHYDFRGLGSSGASVSPPRSTIQMLKSLLGSDARWMLQSVTFPSLSLRQRSHSSVSCLSPHMLASCVSCKT